MTRLVLQLIVVNKLHAGSTGVFYSSFSDQLLEGDCMQFLKIQNFWKIYLHLNVYTSFRKLGKSINHAPATPPCNFQHLLSIYFRKV